MPGTGEPVVSLVGMVSDLPGRGAQPRRPDAP
jgi:hypothetical protein